MDDRNSFASELVALRDDISEDVGGILQVVRERKMPNIATSPAKKVEPANDAPTDPVVASSTQQVSRPSSRHKADEPVILENVTTRLSRQTNERLAEAALHQKLKKVEPDTRQGIIEEAVCEWLQRHRYV